jgi:predicted nucleic acid-binding protein
MAEIRQKIPYIIKVLKMKKLTAVVSDLQATTDKQPSKVDLSLLQVAIDHPEIKGIITYDKDFKRIASAGIITQGKTNFFVGTAEEFLKKRGK